MKNQPTTKPFVITDAIRVQFVEGGFHYGLTKSWKQSGLPAAAYCLWNEGVVDATIRSTRAALAKIATEGIETRARVCSRCGSPKPAGQSCGCFDNDSQ